MNRRKLGRWISVISVITLVTAGLGGCQSKTGSDTGETTEDKTESMEKETGFTPSLDTDKKVSLEIAGFMGNFESLDQVVNNFNEYYPEVSVSYEQNSGTQLVDYLENNDYVDIFMTSESSFAYPDDKEQYVADYCLDLSKEDIDFSAIQDEMIEAGTVDGKMLRLPLAQNTFGMVVNKTLLENEGLDIPTNWEEFLEVLEELKQKGYVPIQGSSIHVCSDMMANIALSQIGNDENLRKKLSERDASAAEQFRPLFEKLEELIQNGYTDYTINDTYPADNYDGAILKFFEGDVPIWICSTECVSGMKKRESKSEAFTENPFEYQFLYVPLGEKGAYEYREPWYGFSVNKDSDVKDYAVEFMRFLATEDQINLMASVKGMPSVAKNSTDEKYDAIQKSENIERSYIDNGEINNAIKSSIADVSNQFGKGGLKDVDEAVAELEKRISEQ